MVWLNWLLIVILIAELYARFARAWAEPHSLVNLPIPENLVMTWPYTDRRPPTADRPSVRTTGQPMFTLTLLASLEAQEKINCTSMLWSIDSCRNRASADQYHLTVARAQVPTHRCWVFFWSYPLTNYQFKKIAGSSLFFPRIHIKYVVFMSPVSYTHLTLPTKRIV